MNDRLAKAEALFHDALELPPERRESFLHTACGEDAELLREVAELLRASGIADEWLKDTDCAAADPGEGAHSRVSELPGTVIDRYKLLEKIGEGGFGVVYMAEQQEPVRRKVALKIIKFGMDTKSVIARFEAERQALALMDHPNIAKVLDAGATDTGRPYFVMELVRGVPITKACHETHLSLNQRLDLFIQVCSAIQHAHQKGIIHRDIKPTNVLVTSNDGMLHPMVIDFGVAKALNQRLTEKTLFTNFAQMIGTPAYMSPEQAEMSKLDVDTRSDIYSLGVLLYELLTGTTPFSEERLRSTSYAEMQRIICEEEPERPSTRLKRKSAMASPVKSPIVNRKSKIENDLDWIVMKCLEKDRTRRYETANGLSADLRRFLNNEPVVARPPSIVYRLRKLAYRNKLVFAAVFAVAAALLAGAIFSSWQAVRATRAERQQSLLREKAEGNEQKATAEAVRSAQIAQFLKDMLTGVGPSVALGRDTTMLREILDRTAERVSRELTNHPEAQIELWTTLSETYHDIGLFHEAESMARQAVEFSRTRHGDQHLATARAQVGLGWALYRLVDTGQAETCLRQAIVAQRRLLPTDHQDLAASLDKLAEILRRQGKTVEAEQTQREAIAMKKRLLGNDDRSLPRSLDSLGMLLRDSGGNIAEAEALFREASALSAKLLGEEHPYVAIPLTNLGELLRKEGKLSEAKEVLHQAIAIQRKVLGPHHLDLAKSLDGLGVVFRLEGNLAEAESLHREAWAIRIRSTNVVDRFPVESFAALLSQQNRFAELAEVYRSMAERGHAPSQTELAQMYAAGRGVPKDQGEAARWYRKAAERYREAAEGGDSTAQNSLGRVLERGQGVPRDRTEAFTWYRKAAEAGNRTAQLNVGRAYERGTEVEQDLTEAAKWYRKAGEQDTPEAQYNLGWMYARGEGVATNRVEALMWFRRAAEKIRKTAQGGDVATKDQFAWLLATCEFAEVRNATNAIEFAEQAVAATQRADPNYLDTLAAAYAEAGEFAKAVSVQKEAISLLQDEKQKTVLESRLKLYESNSPYRGR